MVGTQFPNATDPQTGKYLTFKASKWTSGGWLMGACLMGACLMPACGPWRQAEHTYGLQPLAVTRKPTHPAPLDLHPPAPGYLAGIYLHAFALTGDERWAELGVAELAGLEDAADETESHKGSHLYDSSYVEALEAGVPLAETARWQRVIRTAADALVQR